MAVEPNTTIKLYSGVPLDSDYRHTLYFANIQAQQFYFNSDTILKYTISNNTYQRVNKGTLRIEKKADDLYDCNYLAFQNTNYGSKWFYAFITKVEYVNDNVTEISYEIDDIQTYFLGYDIFGNKLVHFEDSFVEREHTETDNVGDNLLDENLEMGEYISADMGDTGHLSNLSVVVAIPYETEMDGDDVVVVYDDIEKKPVSSIMRRNCGLYSGINYVVFPIEPHVSSNTPLWRFLRYLDKKGLSNDIVSIYYQPTDFTSPVNVLVNDVVEYAITKDKRNSDAYNPYGSYIPKNKKLYTYPYNMLYVTNQQGVNAVFPFEYFALDTACTFILTATNSPSCEVMLYPGNYKGIINNIDEKITLSGYSSCAYNIDDYKNYIANHKTSLALSLISNTIQAVAGASLVAGSIALTGGATTPMALAGSGAISLSSAQAGYGIMRGASSANSGLMGVEKTLAQLKDRKVSPAQAGGSSANNVMLASNNFEFKFYNKHIRNEYVKIIDDYFNMYGYKCNRVKTPNLHSRPYWNYIKTIGANIYGKAPASVIEHLQNIFDNGITFWHVPGLIGDYSQDNSPVA